MAAEFKEKDEVFVTSLNKLGVVVAVLREGVYQVQVGPLKIKVQGSDLKAPTAINKSLLKTLKNIAKPVAGSKKNPPTQPARLDLHGMRVEDAMRAVEKAMDRAIIDGHGRMEIIHGIGSGRVREALHQYLKTLPIIEHFKVDDINPGVTWVYF